MGETTISWTARPGTVARTWNPTQGCALKSEGCRNCYAMRQARRFAGAGRPFEGLVNLKTGKWTGEARLATHKLDEPLSWRKPSTVFVDSMSDLFYERFTNEEIAAVFGVMAATPQHTYQILTKRADRMRAWFEWVDKSITRHWHGRWGVLFEHLEARLGTSATDAAWMKAIAHEPVPQSLGDAGCHEWPLPNVWLGVSVEDQAAADERIPQLFATPAAIRFLSCEPLLGHMSVAHWLAVDPRRRRGLSGELEPGLTLDWIIAGAESGPMARACDASWLRALRDECRAVGLPFFLKQAVAESWSHAVYPSAHAARVAVDVVSSGAGSRAKGRGFGGLMIESPYLDGKQHMEWPA